MDGIPSNYSPDTNVLNVIAIHNILIFWDRILGGMGNPPIHQLVPIDWDKWLGGDSEHGGGIGKESVTI